MSPNTMALDGQVCWHAVTTLPVFELTIGQRRFVLLAADPVHAERALLHHTLRAGRHVWIELPVQWFGERVEGLAFERKIEPVEVPDLVRAVVEQYRVPTQRL